MTTGPAVLKVLDYIRRGIASGTIKPGDALPSRAVLGGQILVSTQSVAKAIGLLKRSGELCGVAGQRARVPLPADADQSSCRNTSIPQSRQRPWAIAAERIKNDIASGAFAPGKRIPSRKELSSRYDISTATVRKALDSCVADGIIIARGRGFAVPTAAISVTGAHILFLWFSADPYLPSHETDKAFLGALERACHQSGVGLDKLMVSSQNGDARFMRHEERRFLNPRLPESCIGVVYLVNWKAAVDNSVFSWLAHLGKPVSIIDWLGNWEPPHSLRNKQDTQWIRSSSTKGPGRDVGRYLLGLGHRHIAYFSPFGAQWQAMRLAGITEAFGLSREPCRVIPYVKTPTMDATEIKQTIMREIAPSYDGLFRARGAGDYLSGITIAARANFDYFEGSRHFDALVPLFEQALSDPATTAWVGCNDTVAMMAWSFLRSRGRKIPKDLSVMGFDNTAQAIEHDLTSYDLNFPAAAHTATHFLLRPNAARAMPRLGKPAIEGFIIERGSTARV